MIKEIFGSGDDFGQPLYELMLTDELVKIDNPDFAMTDLPLESLTKWNAIYFKTMNV